MIKNYIYCLFFLNFCQCFALDEKHKDADFGKVLISENQKIKDLIAKSPNLEQEHFENGEIPVSVADAIKIGKSHALAIIAEVNLSSPIYKYTFIEVKGAQISKIHGKFIWQLLISYSAADKNNKQDEELTDEYELTVWVMLDGSVVPPIREK